MQSYVSFLSYFTDYALGNFLLPPKIVLLHDGFILHVICMVAF